MRSGRLLEFSATVFSEQRAFSSNFTELKIEMQPDKLLQVSRTSFSVADILDPSKFTGRPNITHPNHGSIQIDAARGTTGEISVIRSIYFESLTGFKALQTYEWLRSYLLTRELLLFYKYDPWTEV